MVVVAEVVVLDSEVVVIGVVVVVVEVVVAVEVLVVVVLEVVIVGGTVVPHWPGLVTSHFILPSSSTVMEHSPWSMHSSPSGQSSRWQENETGPPPTGTSVLQRVFLQSRPMACSTGKETSKRMTTILQPPKLQTDVKLPLRRSIPWPSFIELVSQVLLITASEFETLFPSLSGEELAEALFM